MSLTDHTKASHRRDIDGLRCLAILPVVFFHLASSKFSGGFVGVDVFFVISGYLITGIVAREVEQGRFSFATFYERRVRRIAPALFVMLAFCTVGAYFFLLPSDLVNYGRSLVAAILSLSNIYFWTQADYFNPTYVKLLLHTWSLSVEEQFYLALPITIFMLRRRIEVMRAFLAGICFLSLGISTWVSYKASDAAFYMPFSRAWELLIGSLIAVYKPRVRSRILNEVLAAVGLGMVLYAIFAFTSTTVFPGPWGLLPCLGAGLLLLTGEGNTAVGALLSLRPIAFIGLISYSVYLVHWPVILFEELGMIPARLTHGKVGTLGVVALCLALGALSWRFVETPFRIGGSKRWSRKRIWLGFCVGGGTIVAAAAVLLITAGIPSRFPQRAIELASYLDNPQPNREGVCFITPREEFQNAFKRNVCASKASDRPTYVLVGDSHGAAMWYAFDQVLSHVHMDQVTSSSCLPFRGSYDLTNCGRMRRFFYEEYLPQERPDLVLLAPRWAKADEARKMDATLHWFKQQNIAVAVIGPTQEYRAPLPLLLAYSLKKRDPDLPSRYLVRNSAVIEESVRAVSGGLEIPFLSARQRFCSAQKCMGYVDAGETIPLMTDNNHLTYQAAELLVEDWVARGQLSPERFSPDRQANAAHLWSGHVANNFKSSLSGK